jgi:hypothetical protein
MHLYVTSLWLDFLWLYLCSQGWDPIVCLWLAIFIHQSLGIYSWRRRMYHWWRKLICYHWLTMVVVNYCDILSCHSYCVICVICEKYWCWTMLLAHKMVLALQRKTRVCIKKFMCKKSLCAQLLGTWKKCIVGFIGARLDWLVQCRVLGWKF